MIRKRLGRRGTGEFSLGREGVALVIFLFIILALARDKIMPQLRNDCGKTESEVCMARAICGEVGGQSMSEKMASCQPRYKPTTWSYQQSDRVCCSKPGLREMLTRNDRKVTPSASSGASEKIVRMQMEKLFSLQLKKSDFGVTGDECLVMITQNDPFDEEASDYEVTVNNLDLPYTFLVPCPEAEFSTMMYVDQISQYDLNDYDYRLVVTDVEEDCENNGEVDRLSFRRGVPRDGIGMVPELTACRLADLPREASPTQPASTGMRVIFT